MLDPGRMLGAPRKDAFFAIPTPESDSPYKFTSLTTSPAIFNKDFLLLGLVTDGMLNHGIPSKYASKFFFNYVDTAEHDIIEGLKKIAGTFFSAKTLSLYLVVVFRVELQNYFHIETSNTQ
jgi:hypothetical protein